MNRRKLLGYAVLLLLAGALAVWLRGCIRIDSCLDRGGAWNYEVGSCVGAMH
jgi:hypothetical protein